MKVREKLVAHTRACLVVAPLAASALLVAPGMAYGVITQGSASDPVGDSAGTASQDIVSATAHYDTNGQVTVSATMNGNIASGPESFFSFAVASYAPPESCTGVTASLFGFSTSTEGSTTLTGYSGAGSALISVVGNTISFTTAGPAYANKSFSCMQVFVTSKGEGGILDRLAPPLWFTGFGPPPTPAPTPTPTPTPAPQPTPTPTSQQSEPTPTSLASQTREFPTVSAFAAAAGVGLSSGTGTLKAGCGGPATSNCTFALALFLNVMNGHASGTTRAKVGTVTGKVRGGGSGELSVKLNAAGRRFLKRGALHVEARGTVTSVTSDTDFISPFHRRITIKQSSRPSAPLVVKIT